MRVSEAIGLDAGSTQSGNYSHTADEVLESRGTYRFSIHGRGSERYAEPEIASSFTTHSCILYLGAVVAGITEWTARYTFAKLSQHLGSAYRPRGTAVATASWTSTPICCPTLVRWYRAGSMSNENSPSWLPNLGHVTSTIPLVLEAVPRTLQLATDR